jgi:hypothetical protein
MSFGDPSNQLSIERIASLMDIRSPLGPRLTQRYDLLSSIVRIFLSSHQSQTNQTIDSSTEGTFV